MGKKRAEDEGLKFLKLMNARRFKTPRNIFSDLVTEFGKKEAEDYLDPVEELQCTDHVAMYEAKNADFDKSMMYTMGMDADIMRKTVNWIFEHRAFFGKKILDIGCDCGIMSCYLAMTFPESKIVSIDKGTNGPLLATQLAEKLNLKNIEFAGNTDIKEYQEEDFDTVFTMRTARENEDFLTYAKAVCERIKSGGCVVTIEKLDDAEFEKWINAFEDNGLSIKEGTKKTLVCDEVDVKVSLNSVVIG